jgi:hypothetical protein
MSNWASLIPANTTSALARLSTTDGRSDYRVLRRRDVGLSRFTSKCSILRKAELFCLFAGGSDPEVALDDEW